VTANTKFHGNSLSSFRDDTWTNRHSFLLCVHLLFFVKKVKLQTGLGTAVTDFAPRLFVLYRFCSLVSC